MPEQNVFKAIPPRLIRFLAFLFCLLPPVLLAILIWRNAVNVPWLDEWDTDIAGTFFKSHTGQLTFGDLWAQHTETRLLLPRIFFLVLGNLTHWNVLYEMAATFFLAVVIAATVFHLGRLTFPGKPWIHWPAFFLSSLMIFSPVQSEAWLWGMELILYVPLLCILLSLAFHYSRAGNWPVWLMGVMMAMISTYTFINGLLVWVVLFPVFFLADGRHGLWEKRRPALAWLAAFLANGLIYFHNYTFPPANGLWQKPWTNPLPLLHYFLAFLGEPLSDIGWSGMSQKGPISLAIATIFGGIAFTTFVVCCFCAFRRRNDPRLMRLVLPWLAIGWYGVFSAALATSGRALEFGAEQALSSRYGIFGISLLIALVHLMPLLGLHGLPAGGARKRMAGFCGAGVILAVGFLLVLPPEMTEMNFIRLSRLLGKSGLDFIQVLPQQPATGVLFPRYPTLLRMAGELNQQQIFDRPLLADNRLSSLKQPALSSDEILGHMENFKPLPGMKFQMSGWAISPFHAGPADCVVFTYETPTNEPVIFKLMGQRVFRYDLAAKTGDNDFLMTGWIAFGDNAELPKGPVRIRAWAYDVEERTVAPLQGKVDLDIK